jgi:ferric-dicitrate binding protein FerR (iron transport regulator)
MRIHKSPSTCALLLPGGAPTRFVKRGFTFGFVFFLTVGPLVLPTQSADTSIYETHTRNQRGKLKNPEGTVLFVAPTLPPAKATNSQRFDFGDKINTLIASRALAVFENGSSFRMRELTLLEIIRDEHQPSTAGIRLEKGEIYFSNRGVGPQRIGVSSPDGEAIPEGTEYVIRVDPLQGVTEVTMLDGMAQLSNNRTNAVVRTGEQASFSADGDISVRPILKARNIVQWWIYYPAVLDPRELDLDPADAAQLAASLEAYRRGDLQAALQLYPGYPTPAHPSTQTGRTYLAALWLAVGKVESNEKLLGESPQPSPADAALRTLILAASGAEIGVAAPTGRAAHETETSKWTASRWLAESYSEQATHQLADAPGPESPNWSSVSGAFRRRERRWIWR